MRIQINESTAHKLRKVLSGAKDPDMQEVAADIGERLEKQTRVGFLTPDELEALADFLPEAIAAAENRARDLGRRIGNSDPIAVVRDRALGKIEALAGRSARRATGG